jgi:hypothetical protein
VTTMTEPRIWPLDLPIPVDMLSSNNRLGWRGEAKAVAEWRGSAFTTARQHKLPTGLARVRIDICVWPAHRRLDRATMEPLCKAVVDGFGPPFFRKPNPKTGYRGASAPGYNLIPNDDPTHLDGHHLHLLDPLPPRGRVLVLITDLSHVPASRTWTPRRPTSAGTKGTVKRACNGCGSLLGDVTDTEIEAAMGGEPLPDVRHECPNCKTDTHCHEAQDGVLCVARPGEPHVFAAQIESREASRADQ